MLNTKKRARVKRIHKNAGVAGENMTNLIILAEYKLK